jgi:hypothetical protein
MVYIYFFFLTTYKKKGKNAKQARVVEKTKGTGKAAEGAANSAKRSSHERN